MSIKSPQERRNELIERTKEKRETNKGKDFISFSSLNIVIEPKINAGVLKAVKLYLDDSEWENEYELDYKLQCLMTDHLQNLKRGSWKGNLGSEFAVFDELNFMDMVNLIVEIRNDDTI